MQQSCMKYLKNDSISQELDGSCNHMTDSVCFKGWLVQNKNCKLYTFRAKSEKDLLFAFFLL